MRKEELICEVLRVMKEITIYRDGYKNTFLFQKDDVDYFISPSDCVVKINIFGKLKKEEVFNMSLGEAYFYVNEKPCACKLTQINHPRAGVRDNYEMVIIIELNRLNLDKGSVISDFQTFFSKYEGPIFEHIEHIEHIEEIGFIENRLEILDL